MSTRWCNFGNLLHYGVTPWQGAYATRKGPDKMIPASGWHIERDTAIVYKVRSADQFGGWASATIREWAEGGALDVQSDWGTFSYSWNAIGDRPLRAFLAELSFDYFMGKTRDSHRILDWDETVTNLKRSIMEDRRSGSLEREEARERWDDVESMEDTSSADVFCERFFHFAWAYEWCDGSDPAKYRDDPNCRQFWDGPWQELRALWKTETAAVAA